MLESFDGIGYGLDALGINGAPLPRNPADNSLAVGPDHVFQIVNSRIAVFTKRGKRFETTGRLLYGPIATNTLFQGFGDVCGSRTNGDAVVRYDQLAGRWLVVMPIFRRAVPPRRTGEPVGAVAKPGDAARPGQASDPGPPMRPAPPPAVPAPSGSASTPAPAGEPRATYAICYAVSVTGDPLGEYNRYIFERTLFPDYPRPAVWPDGYCIPTSTGDDVIQKHTCIVDRTRMLDGRPATEQCLVINGVNFLNNADLDGLEVPPPGAPNIMMATGGTQLEYDIDDDGIYVWNVHVDPDGAYRWMASPAIDKRGHIGIGYSFGGADRFAGQRFAARLADDPPGLLTFRESVLAEGEAAQTNTLRWEDYSQTAVDPSDDCTIWYVGDYFKKDAPTYSTRIGAFRVPGCN